MSDRLDIFHVIDGQNRRNFCQCCSIQSLIILLAKWTKKTFWMVKFLLAPVTYWLLSDKIHGQNHCFLSSTNVVPVFDSSIMFNPLFCLLQIWNSNHISSLIWLNYHNLPTKKNGHEIGKKSQHVLPVWPQSPHGVNPQAQAPGLLKPKGRSDPEDSASDSWFQRSNRRFEHVIRCG